ncbi:MAG: hypothetical protein ACJAU2_000751 [Maribacter sp.]|jgi:hypothetical protein
MFLLQAPMVMFMNFMSMEPAGKHSQLAMPSVLDPVINIKPVVKQTVLQELMLFFP